MSDVRADSEGPAGEDNPPSAASVVLDKLASGGVTMLVLAALSVVGAACAIERFVNFRRSLVIPDRALPEIERLWASGRFEALGELCTARPSTLTRAVAFLLENRTHPDHAALVREASEICSRELRMAMQRAFPLAVVATLAPLVGLFGTVLGMIMAFDQVALVGELGDPTVLAGGISLALVTTASGLLVAIPALGLHHYFRSRAHVYAIGLEHELSRLARKWFAGPVQA